MVHDVILFMMNVPKLLHAIRSLHLHHLVVIFVHQYHHLDQYLQWIHPKQIPMIFFSRHFYFISKNKKKLNIRLEICFLFFRLYIELIFLFIYHVCCMYSSHVILSLVINYIIIIFFCLLICSDITV